jgi:hypothetical protein
MSENLIDFIQLPLNRFVDNFPFPPPISAQETAPSWYKAQPSSFSKEGEDRNANLTIKKCLPIFDAMTMGYLLLMPVDLYINTKNEQVEWRVDEEFSSIKDILISWHSSEQVSHYPSKPNIYVNNLLRIMPMWMTKTPEGYSTLFMPPIHQSNIPIKAVEAVIDTDRFLPSSRNVFFLEKDFEGVIKQGTPIVQVIPFKREAWKMSLGVDKNAEQVLDQRKRKNVFHPNGYRNIAWDKKNFG